MGPEPNPGSVSPYLRCDMRFTWGAILPSETQITNTGERLTLNFQDIDARAVLQLLADISGRNIVVSDTVKGNVTRDKCRNWSLPCRVTRGSNPLAGTIQTK